MTGRSGNLRPVLKAGALLVYLLLFLPDCVARLRDVEGAVGHLAYLALVVIAVIGLLGAALIRSPVLRWIFALILAAGAYVLEAYGRATREFLTYGAFIDLISATGFIEEAMLQNETALLAGLPVALLLLVAIGLAPPAMRAPRWVRSILPLAPVAAATIFTGLAFLRGGDGMRTLPGGYAPVVYSLLAGYEAASGDLGPRERVSIDLTRDPLYRDVVLIVDESISGHYLDINGPDGARSGLAERRPGIAIVNFGIAAAATNCSAGTNLVLRYGGTRATYRRDVALGPSLWAYARKAGFETVYIDAQRTGGATQNLMGEGERALIDRFIQFDAVPVVDRDMAAARVLAEVLDDGRASFVLVNKVGAHFPIAGKYPQDRTVYRPNLPRRGLLDVTDTGSRAGFGGSVEDWRRYRNSYRNTLAWNVGTFFDRLLSQRQLDGTLIVYTGDHGQNLHEDGSPGTTTHCSVNPQPEEGAVPLVVLQGEGGGLSFSRGRQVSHYMIAPTLLAAMGYDRVQVEKRYGGALDQPSSDPGTFNYLYNARLNRQPQWRRVDPASLPALPDDGEATQ